MRWTPAAGGTVAIELEGFVGRERRVGAPEIPTKTILVAIPRDARPRLTVRSLGEELHPGVTPQPVGKRVVDPSEVTRRRLRSVAPDRDRSLEVVRESVELLRRPDPAIYESASVYPDQPAWLGRTGSLRDQRYVEVHLAPVRYDGATGSLTRSSALEITVVFEGGSLPEGPSRGGAAEARFEPVYENAFVNYEQGRSFRMSGYAGVGSARKEGAATTALSGTSPIQKIKVSNDGMIRLTHAFLQANAPDFLLEANDDPNEWALFNKGLPVPLEIHQIAGDDAKLEANEWVQFYGEALDDEPKAILNTDITFSEIDLWEARDYSDVNVYFLTVDPASASSMDSRSALPSHVLTPPDFFTDVAREEVDDNFNPLSGADPWYWEPLLAPPGQGVDEASRTDSVTLPGLYSVCALATGTVCEEDADCGASGPCNVLQDVQIRVNVRGLTESFPVDPDHTTRVTVRNASGSVVGTPDEESCDNRCLLLHDITWTGGSLPAFVDPMEVELEALDVGGGALNWVVMDYIEIEYPRTFEAVGGALVFEWTDDPAEFVIDGLPDDSPVVYELTELPASCSSTETSPVRLDPVEVSAGPAPYSIRFEIDDICAAEEPMRRFAVAGGIGIGAPALSDFVPDAVSDLRDTTNSADLIVIAHPDVVAACHATDSCAPTDPLRALLDHRATSAGGGLTSKIAMIEDVQDEFNHGLAGPQAIEEFLRWALSDASGEGWAGKPSHVMLLGDGSYDYKAGTANGNLVPTQLMFKEDTFQWGHYASDNLLAAVTIAGTCGAPAAPLACFDDQTCDDDAAGALCDSPVPSDDQLPDLFVGRIPVRTLTDADDVLTKIKDYETQAPPGAWRQHALFVSDGDGSNIGEALAFEATNALAISKMPPPYTSKDLRYWSDYLIFLPEEVAKETMRADIKAGVNGADGFEGAALMQYNGHGNTLVWSSDAFFDERGIFHPKDTLDLNNGLKLPWLMAHNCLTGAFHVPALDTVGEDWLLRNENAPTGPPRGGAVAVLSPSGLGFNYIGNQVVNIVFPEMFEERKERELSVVVMQALVALCGGSIEACQHYALLGDPATRLALRSVDPATGLDADPGNAEVQLTWTAGANATSYVVFRSVDVSVQTPFYQEIGTTSNVSFLDSTAENAVTYYYYVLAKDDDGFESAWSNFNTDCDVDGPDCVKARPLNPDPPSKPTGVTVADPGSGNSLDVSWTENPEEDIDFYTVHYGLATDDYSLGSLNVDEDKTSVTIGGLTENTTYFIAVTATNTSEKESDFSDEVDDFPVLAPGLRSPDFITDLTMRPDPADPDNALLEWTEVTADVYGKPKTVLFYEIYRDSSADFSGAVLLGTCNDPCSSYSDEDAMLAAGPYHYRVRAVDAEGNVSGLGAELPYWTTLTVGFPTPDGVCSISLDPCWDASGCPDGETCDGGTGNPGTIVLSWDAVTTTLDGGPLDLLHYVIYTSDERFSRADVRDGLVDPPLMTVTGTSVEFTPPTDPGYYSVLVVDVRGNVSPF